MIADQFIPRAKPGRVKLGEAVKGYARALKAQPGGTNADAQRDLARRRAEKIEIEIAKEKGELVDLSICIALQQMLAGAIVSELSNWSARVSRDDKVRAAIDREVAASLDRIRKVAETGAAELLNVADDDADEVEADAA